MREVVLKRMRKPMRFRTGESEERRSLREILYFCEKESGTVRFQAEADAAGEIPLERAAGLLAMQCLIRGQVADDYVVLVAAKGNILDHISTRTKELLEASLAVAAPIRLSAREKEVLRGILNSLLNKQIAALLCISERTVKFHVSSLLAKFRVHNRLELMQVAPRCIAGEPPSVQSMGQYAAFPARLLTA
jgi:DNA-binding CsgD family transcriptional regulator